MKFLTSAKMMAMSTALSVGPWASLWSKGKGEILGVMTGFVVPAAGLVCIIFGFIQLSKCITMHRQGQGQEFWQQVAWCIVAFIGGILMSTIWLLFAPYIN